MSVLADAGVCQKTPQIPVFSDKTLFCFVFFGGGGGSIHIHIHIQHNNTVSVDDEMLKHGMQ